MTRKTGDDVRSELLGSWRLIAWESIGPDGTIDYPLGEGAVGQLMYDGNGRMSAQLTRPGLLPFDSDDWREAQVDEMARAWPNYFGYFGTFTVDEGAGEVVHHIEGSWFPNLVGSKQIRRYRFDGPHLVLDADTEWGQVRIIWEKFPA